MAFPCRLDLETERINHLGQHADAISSINFSREQSEHVPLVPPLPPSPVHALPPFRADALITGSWDRTVRFWDPRASNQQQSSHDLPERVYNMDLVNHILVVAMASRLFHIYDIRKMDSPAQTRESSLKFMTRALACMADGQGMSYPSLPVSTDVTLRCPFLPADFTTPPHDQSILRGTYPHSCFLQAMRRAQ